MPNDLEYIVKDALMMCDKGATPVPFSPTFNTTVKVSGCLVTTKADKIPMTNIPAFGACTVKNGSPCTPAPIDWLDTYKVKVKGQETILFKSKLPCGTGGKIEFITSGQVPLPPGELEKLMAEHGAQEEEGGLSWWDAAELIPFVGGVIGTVRSAAKDPTDWLGVGLSVASIALDVAGLFSFGAGNVASAAVKTGKLARVGAKALKVASKGTKAAKLTAAGAKGLAKAAAKSVDDFAMKTGKVCVFACFTEGTPIAILDGHKNIEDIKIGDKVWAFNEETGESDLKQVVNTMQNEVDATIQITLNKEVIETTAEHPFYTRTGWKDAADLTSEDHIKTKKGNWQRVEATNFLYNKKKVYNFEVADWHTYFVGAWEWLVHNVCLHALAKSGEKYAQNILRGIRFNQIIQKRLVDGVHELWTLGMKSRLDTLIPGKFIISRKATQLADVTFETATKYIDEIAKKYKKGKGIQNTKRAGAEKLDGEYVLQVPKQEKPIPQNIKDYAENARVIIEEIEDVTMDMLKWW